VPASSVAKLREVTLWFSPAYPGVKPRAEYHPAAGWLRTHGRDPAMAKGVEFTDVLNFEAETKRMPNFTLHELAHAYHDRELPDGFGNPEIKAAFERAKAGKSYEQVERWFGMIILAAGTATALSFLPNKLEHKALWPAIGETFISIVITIFI
jgi:hypothetical protein